MTLRVDEGPILRRYTAIDPEERLELLLRDLRTSRTGLGQREAGRRLLQFGPNLLERRRRRRWLPELAHQFTHPLALLLWAAAALAWIAGILAVAVAIVIVIAINAAFAFIQEMQAERAVEALARYLPERARVLRNGAPCEVAAKRARARRRGPARRGRAHLGGCPPAGGRAWRWTSRP